MEGERTITEEKRDPGKVMLEGMGKRKKILNEIFCAFLNPRRLVEHFFCYEDEENRN